MIVAIDGIIGDFRPINGEITAEISNNRVILRANGLEIEAGARFFVVKERGLDIKIDPRTGHFTTEGKGSATLRALVGDTAFDLTLDETPDKLIA